MSATTYLSGYMAVAVTIPERGVKIHDSGIVTRRESRTFKPGRWLLTCGTVSHGMAGHSDTGPCQGAACGRREWFDLGPGEEPFACSCGAWFTRQQRLTVERHSDGGKRHTCENTCQVSESMKCRCACGGKQHGRLIREADSLYMA